ncbi:tumor necrosis factor alpha-induced protein 2 [Gadus chalcogrammus]|uniref:tumor necrosis factor alpha-induced protein 2 n=1 Tax=Gadus chalcogrammus TaxID=1042646 RepID=UPI0024C42591|nr:tumor necrosis factor alpha-induced protein 2 [Gadus chalcogrammus]
MENISRGFDSHCISHLKSEEASFEELLEGRRLSEAAGQLIAREEGLFGGAGQEVGGAVQIARLASDRTVFTSRLRQALSRSFSSEVEDVEVLRAAVDAIRKDEEQDRRWQGTGRVPPDWRPGGFWALHDEALADLVEARVNGASSPGDGQGLSSIEREILEVGRQLKEDLGWVVRVVKDCYPAEVDICNLYGRLYHRAFSSRLSMIAEFGLEDEDCRVLLRWVNSHYPSILRDEALRGEVDSDRLGPLLPQDLYSPLEAQFLSTTQERLRRSLDLFLKAEQALWSGGAPPMATDGCPSSPLAIDVLQCLNGAVVETKCILGDERKAQLVACVLVEFLDSLKSFLSNVMGSSAGNSRQLLLAHLLVLQQLRDYVVKKAHLFPDDVKERCLHTLSSVKESAHTWLLSPTLKSLKPHYPTLGTCCWLKRPVLQGLLDSLELHIQDLQGLGDPCREGLVGRLQVEVIAEYVSRLLNGNRRLNLHQQVQAAQTVSEHGERLAEVFSRAGPRELWLDGIVSQIAEVLRLQHLPTIQIVVASMGMSYPDLSSKHVLSLLKLKSSLSRSHRAMVQEALADSRKDILTSDPAPPLFFSRVNLK